MKSRNVSFASTTRTSTDGDFVRPTFVSMASRIFTSPTNSDEDRKTRGGMFADAEAMKEKVRLNLSRKAYNVHDFYWDTGCCSALAKSSVFEYTTLFVIFLNGLWIAYDTDNNTADSLVDAPIGFQIVEHSFCFFFSVELLIRFLAFQRKADAFHDAWFVFDTFLVFLMVVETWILTVVILILGGGSSGPLGNASVLRLFRLVRLSRMARALRSMPELMILIKGMVAGFRSVAFTLCLLFVQIYVFSIALRQLTDGTEAGDEFFESIPVSMYNLLLIGTFLEDLKPTVDQLAGEGGHPLFAVVFLLFVSVAALMIMNMLIGVLCEITTAVATTEKEEMTVNFVRTKMRELVDNMDDNYDGCISRVEFEKILANRTAIKILADIGVDPIALVDLADHIFKQDADSYTLDEVDDDSEPGDRTLDFGEFMEIILKLRGCNTATVKDIQNLSKSLKAEIKRLGHKKKKSDKREHSSIKPKGKINLNTTRSFLSKIESTKHSPRDGSMSPNIFHEDSIRNTALVSAPPPLQLQEAWAPWTDDPEIQEIQEIEHIPSYEADGNRLTLCRSRDDERLIRQKTEKVEAWLVAAQSELKKLRLPDLPGSMSHVNNPRLRSWASKLEDTIATGLSELQSLQGYK